MKNLKQLMEDKKLTIHSLAKRIGCSYVEIWRFAKYPQKGGRRINDKWAKKLSVYLGVSPSYLLGISENDNANTGSDWKSISTAPKDGTKIDIWRKQSFVSNQTENGEFVSRCWWQDYHPRGEWVYRGNSNDPDGERPVEYDILGGRMIATHWRHSAEPPEGEKEFSKTQIFFNSREQEIPF
jgi:hypothetical protein